MQATAVNIAAWLRYLGLERYEQALLEHDIRADVRRNFQYDVTFNPRRRR
jgi:hypothetical protein